MRGQLDIAILDKVAAPIRMGAEQELVLAELAEFIGYDPSVSARQVAVAHQQKLKEGVVIQYGRRVGLPFGFSRDGAPNDVVGHEQGRSLDVGTGPFALAIGGNPEGGGWPPILEVSTKYDEEEFIAARLGQSLEEASAGNFVDENEVIDEPGGLDTRDIATQLLKTNVPHGGGEERSMRE